MIKNYYLDESGNTGDITLAAPDFTFDNQPFFVLSCIGIADEAALNVEVARLKTRYKIQAPELKFSSIKKKPGFMHDLISYLEDVQYPIMIEATDKRFSLCIHILECLIIPPVRPHDFDVHARLIKNTFADRLESCLPDTVLVAFCDACHKQTYASISAVFKALHSWTVSCPKDDVVDGILLFLEDTMQDFKNIDSQDADAFCRYLPVPDVARSGKAIQILPHTPSLIHIYGRLNRLHSGDLSTIQLHHDEQLQFDKTLFEGMALAEGDVGKNLPAQPVADYNITKPAQLFFKTSHNTIAIQVADLFAGSISYCLQTMTNSCATLPTEWGHVVGNLIALDDPLRGAGLNVVAASPLKRTLSQYRITSALSEGR